MNFETMGNPKNPVILFFHAMGVTGKSNERIAKYLTENYFCILPTSTVYCKGQDYLSKFEEIKQLESFLNQLQIKSIDLLVASSIGADLAMAFLSKSKREIQHVFIDGGQFAQIGKTTRKFMVPFLYLAIKSIYWTKGKSLKKILWCHDSSIQPYFIEAGKNLSYPNLKKQLSDSLEDKAFPVLSKEMQSRIYFEFGSIEDHFKYRNAVMKSYPFSIFPIFLDYNHMQYQIRDPKGFAIMLKTIIEENHLPDLPFLK